MQVDAHYRPPWFYERTVTTEMDLEAYCFCNKTRHHTINLPDEEAKAPAVSQTAQQNSRRNTEGAQGKIGRRRMKGGDKEKEDEERSAAQMSVFLYSKKEAEGP